MIDSEMHVMVPVQVVFTRHEGQETVRRMKAQLLAALATIEAGCSEHEESVESVAVGSSFIHTREDLDYVLETMQRLGREHTIIE